MDFWFAPVRKKTLIPSPLTGVLLAKLVLLCEIMAKHQLWMSDENGTKKPLRTVRTEGPKFGGNI